MEKTKIFTTNDYSLFKHAIEFAKADTAAAADKRHRAHDFNVYSSLNYDDFFVLPEASMLNEIPDEVMDYVVVTRMKHQVWGVVANAHLIKHYKALNLPVKYVLEESIRKAVPKPVPDAIEPESVRDAMEVSKHLSDFTSSISESMLKVKQVAAELGVSVGEVISLYNVLNLAQASKK